MRILEWLDRGLDWIGEHLFQSPSDSDGFRTHSRSDGSTVYEGSWSVADGISFQVVMDVDSSLVSFYVESTREQNLSWNGSKLVFSTVYSEEPIERPRIDNELDSAVYIRGFVGILETESVPSSVTEEIRHILTNGGRL